jgi:hypothetical protein
MRAATVNAVVFGWRGRANGIKSVEKATDREPGAQRLSPSS